MITNSFNQLPDRYQGVIYILFGSVILLYALGIIEKGITIIIVGLALYAIFMGCQKLGLLKMLSSVEKKLHK
ncbi:MAG TPA: hypothetical protein VKR58_06950 [Aquella sp.]|nr:hypothetical protein [Aquella sp.]